jgi:Uma2 family endonuclease
MPARITKPYFETVAVLLEQLGGIDPARVRLRPTPGRATVKDLIRLMEETDRLYELVDGVLVEKVMGFTEAGLAGIILHWISVFLDEYDLGLVVGADAAMRLMPGLVRLPDVSFVSWERLPVRGEFPTAPVPKLAPDLAVEVLSKGNTRAEMARKLAEYFEAGVRLVWYVDPRKRTVRVYTSPEDSRTLTEKHTLDGGKVLPGFTLPIKKIFARIRRKPG